MSLKSILETIKKKNILVVRFEQTDIHGVARSKYIPASLFSEKAKDGLKFVLFEGLSTSILGDVAEGTGFGEEIGFGDGMMFPDWDTFFVLPWVERTARILIEPTRGGAPVMAHPRVLAKKQLERLRSLGMSLLAAHEYEFRIFDKDTLKPINDDACAHSTIRNTPITGLINHFFEYLPQVGVPIEMMHSEYGPGMVEITYKPAFGIQAADRAHTYRTSIKEMALQEGYVATFMSNPLSDDFFSGCHFNHSLWDIKGKVPLLYKKRKDDSLELSEVGRKWLAGLLAHAPAIRILTAPTVNCLNGVDLFNFFPRHATWGIDNRSCLVRVKISGARGTYFEYRAGSSACNPYISLAAVVAAGMDGVVKKLKLPPRTTGNAFREENVPPETPDIPTNVQDALQRLQQDSVICEALGEEFIKCFSALKLHEAKMAKEALENGDDKWEFNNYFFYL